LTFASDDFDRVAIDQCRLLIPELRSYGEDGQRLPKFVMQRIRANYNNGIHLKHSLRKAVRKDVKEEFGSIILAAILTAVIQFLVTKFLEWLDNR
jgi:hypothetical protein